MKRTIDRLELRGVSESLFDKWMEKQPKYNHVKEYTNLFEEMLCLSREWTISRSSAAYINPDEGSKHNSLTLLASESYL